MDNQWDASYHVFKLQVMMQKKKKKIEASWESIAYVDSGSINTWLSGVRDQVAQSWCPEAIATAFMSLLGIARGDSHGVLLELVLWKVFIMIFPTAYFYIVSAYFGV